MAKEIKNPNAEAVAEAVSKTEKFFTENGKLIAGLAAGVVVVAIAVFCWFKFAYQPAVVEAQGQMALAEQNFIAADYEVALNGDGNVLGFNQIMEEYGAKAGKAVYFYAGVCELQLGNFEAAIKALEKYNGKDAILAARATACIGDAYVGLENYAKALGYFEKAAATLTTCLLQVTSLRLVRLLRSLVRMQKLSVSMRQSRTAIHSQWRLTKSTSTSRVSKISKSYGKSV